MTPDPSTLSPAPVPAADTHSSHSLRLTLSPSPLALCLPQSRPVSVYLYLYRYQINMSCWRFPRGLTVGVQISALLSVIISLVCIFLWCSHPKAVLIMDSQISVGGTQPCLWGTSFPSHSFVYLLICGLIYIYGNVLISLVKFIQIH